MLLASETQEAPLLLRYNGKGRALGNGFEKSFKYSVSTFDNDAFSPEYAVITQLSPDEDPDILQPPPHKRYLAKLISVTSLIPPIVGFYASWVQSQALTELGMKRQLSLKKLSGTSFLLGLEVITCGRDTLHFGRLYEANGCYSAGVARRYRQAAGRAWEMAATPSYSWLKCAFSGHFDPRL